MRRAGDVFVLASGACLLAGQVSWSRLATVPTGGSFASGMTTLSAAMAGLGLGAFLAGALLRRFPPRSLLAFVVPACAALLAATPNLLLSIGGPHVLRLGTTAGLLALAHLPFGMILPCVAGRNPTGARAGTLYALSALGGVAGSLGLSEILAPNGGFDTIGLVLAGLTLASGISLWWTSSRELSPAPLEPRPAARSLIAVAFLLGVLGLTAESLWLQVFGFYWEANAETFGLVVAASIAGLSLGSALGRRVPLATGLLAAALGLVVAASASTLALHAFSFGERLGLAALVVGLPAACFGASFAQLLATAPESTATLIGTNAAGAAAAPLLLLMGGSVVGWPARALVGVACGYGLLGASQTRRPVVALAAVVLLGVGAGMLAPGVPPMAAFHPGARSDTDLAATVMPFLRTGADSTVVVTRQTRSGVDIVWIDRGFQGDTSPLGRRIPSALGRIPCGLLGRPPRHALAIGLGTGLTLAGIAESGVESVDVAELSRGVLDANRTILSDNNGHVLERAGVRVHAGDGRTLLAESLAAYDLIVTDMMFPTVTGAGNLFSREFYALVRSRLAPDGIFVHWIPCFLLDPEDVSSIAAGFLESFPEGTAWIGFLDPHRLIVGLAGGRVAPAPAAPASGRLLLDSTELRALAGAARPLRDADPRLEIRSNRRGETDFGRENLLRLKEGLRRSRVPDDGERARLAWLMCTEAGLQPEGSPEALALYREAARTSADADDAEAAAQAIQIARHLDQARQSAMDGDGERALKELRKAAADPLEGAPNLQLADALAATGNLPEAIRECEAAARKSPRSADAWIQIAWLASTAGDREKAGRAFDTARQLRPDAPPLYEDLARRLGRTIRP